jgi:hypothetical protein
MRRLNVNVAEDPFLNRVIPGTALLALGSAAVLFTVMNLVSFVLLGREFRAQRLELREKAARIEHCKKDIAANQQILGSGSVATFADEVQFVEGVLGAKRFSWTKFLADLESVKAFGVMFKSISPSAASPQVVKVSVAGTANPRAEMLKFEENILKDPRFKGAKLETETRDPGNPMTNFTMTFEYLPGGAP